MQQCLGVNQTCEICRAHSLKTAPGLIITINDVRIRDNQCNDDRPANLIGFTADTNSGYPD